MRPSISSTDINDWRRTCSGRDPEFIAVLEKEADHQRLVENTWLGDEAFKGWSPLSPPNKTAQFEAGGRQPNYLCGGATILNALREGSRTRSAVEIFAAPEIHYATAKRRLGDALFGSSETAAAVTPWFCGKVQAAPDTASEDDIIHEAVVAIFGTNALRALIPNFPFVYACGKVQTAAPSAAVVSAASVSPRRRRGGTCSVSGGDGAAAASHHHYQHVLLMENINDPDDSSPPPPTLDSAIGTMNATDFYLTIVQIAYALKCASEHLSYTHYDLHARNVLLRGIGGANAAAAPVYIPYENGGVLVRARWIATFVEHGFAHFTTRNSRERTVSFGFAAKGHADLVELGIFRDRTNPMTDIYRLLATCAVSAASVGPSANGVWRVCEALFKYFNSSEDLSDIIQKQCDNWFYLPPTPNSQLFTFDGFLSHATSACAEHGFVVDDRGDGEKCGVVVVHGGCDTKPERPVVVCGAGFFDDQPPPPAASGDGPFSCRGSSFLSFADMYASVTSTVPPPRRQQCLSALTRKFISGFTRMGSLMDRALQGVASTVDESVRRTREAFAVAAATGRKRPSSQPPAELLRAIRTALFEYSALVELRVAVLLAVQLFWRDGGRPAAVEAAVCKIESSIAGIGDTVSAVTAAVANAAGSATAAVPPPILALAEIATRNRQPPNYG